MLLMMRLLVMSHLFLNLAQASQPNEATVRTYKLQLFENGKNYANAKKDCEERKAWLVEITDKEIENKVLSMKASHDVWIGLTRQHGEWKWGDGSQLRYSNWKDGSKPKDGCIGLDLAKKHWKTYQCSTKIRYVCQSDAASGNYSNNTCSNGGECAAVDKRCNCTCVPGYFGTRCEKELVSLSTTQSTKSLKKGEHLNITIDVQSYDGNVDIAWHAGSNAQQRSKQVYLEKPGAQASWKVSLGMQLANTTYRFEAIPASPLESESYTKTLNVIVIVEDQCKSFPCKNGGSCIYKTTSPYYKCTCNSPYEGLQCQEKFVLYGNCQYHVYNDVSIIFKNANTTCAGHGGTLAMLKTAAAQDVVENQIINQYGENDPRHSELWIGGHKIGNTWYWLDGTKILRQDQRWQNPNNQRLIISTWPSKTVNNMTWYSKNVTFAVRGYVCEKSVKDPCLALNCLNGGTCVTLGCQANCNCVPGFDGEECKSDLLIIAPEKYHYLAEEGKTVNVSMAIYSRNGLVNLRLYNESVTSLTLLETRTTKKMNETVTFTIGPFHHQTPNGTYVFQATSQSGSAGFSRSATITITVEGPPLLKINQSILVLPVARETTINCTGFGIPVPVAYWQTKNQNITDNASMEVNQKNVGSTATLHFSKTARKQVGNYTCYARNIVGGRTKIAKQAIVVQATAQLLNSSKFTPDNPVLVTAFSCTFEAYPEPDIRWKWKTNADVYKYIDSNENGHVFKIKTVNEKTAPLFVKTSTLNIILTQYYDQTTVYCETSNVDRKVPNQSFTFNQNLFISGSKSYKIYNKTVKNHTEAKSMCKVGNQDLAKSLKNDTHQLLARKLQSISLLNVLIDAQRKNHDGIKIWKWDDGEFLYNETKHGTYNKSSVAFVDGHFVAWNKGEPAGENQDCVIMKKSKSWRWSSAKCSEKYGFICECTIAGIPKNFQVSVEQCSTNIVVSWKTAAEAFGITHRLDIVEVNNSQNNDSAMQIPKDGGTISNSFENKGNHKTYDVKVTVCPQCPLPYSTSKRVTTSDLTAPAEKHPFLAANINSNSPCNLSWTMNSSAEGIIGFKLLIHSTPAHAVSTTHEIQPKKMEHNLSLTSSQYLSDTQPNRNYTFFISAITCSNIGPAFKFESECISETAAPLVVPSSIILPGTNNDNTVTIHIKLPDQTNGPLSCIFVIVIYKPASNNGTMTNYGREELLKAMKYSKSANSLNPGKPYIALVFNRGDMLDVAVGAEHFTRKLGDGSYSACDLNERSQRRKKRSSDTSDKIEALNRRLEDDTKYNYFTVTATPGSKEVYFQSSVVSSFTKTPKSEEILGASGTVAGLSVAIVILFATAAIMVAVYMKKKEKFFKQQGYEVNMGIPMDAIEETAENDDHVYANAAMDRTEKRSGTDIPLLQLQTIYDTMVANKNSKFLEEFDRLKESAKLLDYPTEIALRPALKKKNRYKNILPSDSSRVVLGASAEDGYINACYINGYNKVRKFIAAQGPLPSTVDDFWQMIVEQKCTVIVMLTKCRENLKVKCEKYWPDLHASQDFNGVKVTNAEEANFGSFIVRTFEVRTEVQELTVSQLYFLSWPDHGVPTTTTNIIRCHAFMCELKSDAPIVVHCSAGAGRTGTFIAYDFLSQEAEYLASVDVYNCVLKLRKQRVDMVQNCDQYVLVHKLLLENHLFGTTDISADLTSNVLSRESVLSKEFDDLAFIPKANCTEHVEAENNRDFNRSQDIVPYEHNKVIIVRRDNESVTPYINASTVETYDNTTVLIAAQAPMPNCVELFWRAVIDNDVTTIVMLTTCNEGNEEQSTQYWPDEEDEDMSLNHLTVKLLSTQSDGQIITRELEVTAEEKKIVMHYQYTGWKTDQCPSDATDVLKLVDKMLSDIQGNKKTTVMVVCSDGAGRTGTFCAIANLIERVKVEKKVDVFRTVKDLRDCRPKMVQTLDQYRFCYEAVSTYLSLPVLSPTYEKTEKTTKSEAIYENWQ